MTQTKAKNPISLKGLSQMEIRIPLRGNSTLINDSPPAKLSAYFSPRIWGPVVPSEHSSWQDYQATPDPSSVAPNLSDMTDAPQNRSREESRWTTNLLWFNGSDLIWTQCLIQTPIWFFFFRLKRFGCDLACKLLYTNYKLLQNILTNDKS